MVQHRVSNQQVEMHNLYHLVQVVSDDPWNSDIAMLGQTLQAIAPSDRPEGFESWQTNPMYGHFCRPCYSLQWYMHFQGQRTFVLVDSQTAGPSSSTK